MNLVFFGPKMAVSWHISAFQKKGAWNPYFYSVFRVRAFWAKLSKRQILDTHPKKKKIFTDNWKARFWVFFVFSCFFLFLFLFCFFCFVVFFVFLFGGFKGHVRWPFRPPLLALNPPNLFFLFLFFLFFCFLFGGFKGQVRWPEGPPHLALNPPYLFFCLFFCCFLFSFWFLSFLCL